MNLDINLATQKYIDFFGNLAITDIDKFSDFFAEDAIFIDPFQEVKGIAAISNVFLHMFETCEQPKFIITHWSDNNNKAFLQWEFHFKRKNKPKIFMIEGVSLIEFNAIGKVILHKDYWDVSTQVYNHVPILKNIVQFIRKKLAAPQ